MNLFKAVDFIEGMEPDEEVRIKCIAKGQVDITVTRPSGAHTSRMTIKPGSIVVGPIP